MEAQASQNLELGLFSALGILQHYQDELQLNHKERRALVASMKALKLTESSGTYPQEVLEASARRQRIPKKYAFNGGIGRVASLFYLSPIIRHHEIDGTKRSLKAKSLDVGKQVLADGAWMLGPFLFRVLAEALHTIRLRHADHVLLSAFSKLRNDDRRFFTNFQGADASRFFAEVVERRYWGIDLEFRHHDSKSGTFIRPGVGIILLTLMGWNPYLQARSKNDHIPLTQFTAALEKNGLDLSGKKITVIADEKAFGGREGKTDFLFWDIVNTDPINGPVGFQKYLNTATQVDKVYVSDFKELNTALENAKDSDVVFLLAHGKAGVFAINGERLNRNLSKLKAGTLQNVEALVCVSCSFADKSTSMASNGQDGFVELSDHLRGNNSNGKTYGSTKTITLKLRLGEAFGGDPENPTPEQVQQKKEALEKWQGPILTVSVPLLTLYYASGTTHINFVAQKVEEMYSGPSVFENIPQLRIYEWNTGNSQLIPIEIPSKETQP